MKKISLRWVFGPVVALALIGSSSAYAVITDAARAQVNKSVENVPVSELAAKAAEMVTQASPADREDVAVATVQAIVGKRAPLAVTVVASIAKAAPEVAAAAAGKATELNPVRAASIARVAALAAPKYATKIAVAVAKAAPKSASEVAEAVTFAVPSVGMSVADAVVAAVPSAQVAIRSGQLAQFAPPGGSISQDNTKGINGQTFNQGQPLTDLSGNVSQGADPARATYNQ